jgi:hypothetical protein
MGRQNGQGWRESCAPRLVTGNWDLPLAQPPDVDSYGLHG